MSNTTLNAINTGIYSRLAASTALTNLLGGTLIYYLQAPHGATLPYVVFSHQGGGPVNNPSGLSDNVIYIRGYATASAQAGSIDAAIDTAMDTALTVAGATNIWTAREQDFPLVETTPDETLIFSSGALYRVVIDQ